MTVEHLIKLLQTLPKDAKVYYEGGDYKDDWRLVTTASKLDSWGTKGVLLK